MVACLKDKNLDTIVEEHFSLASELEGSDDLKDSEEDGKEADSDDWILDNNEECKLSDNKRN